MGDPSLIPTDRVGPQEAATAGAILSMLLQNKLGWRSALTIVAAGEAFAYFFTVPVASWAHLTPSWYGPLGFTFGFAGIYLGGAAMAILSDFQREPLAVIKRLLIAVRGGGGDPK